MTIKFQVIEVLSKYNITTDKINEVVPKLLTAEYFGEKQEEKILCYYHDTWGRCRAAKLVLLKKEALNDENNNKNVYIKGEFIDKSSNKNIHVRSFINIKDLPEEFIVYYREQPSCNTHKWFSFRVLVRKIKMPDEMPYVERFQ